MRKGRMLAAAVRLALGLCVATGAAAAEEDPTSLPLELAPKGSVTPAEAAAAGAARTKGQTDTRKVPKPRRRLGAAKRGESSRDAPEGHASPLARPGAGAGGFTALTAGQTAAVQGIPREPPDAALAVGSGFVLVAVNSSFAVYDTAGRRRVGPAPLADLFGLEPGTLVFDPRAHYVADAGRWLLVATRRGVAGGAEAALLLAVSRSADPLGRWDRYRFAAAPPGLPGCPCYADFPMLGVNAHGVFVSANLFGDEEVLGEEGELVAASIYAVARTALLGHRGRGAGTGRPVRARQLLVADAITLQATVTPPGAHHSAARGGTAWFVTMGEPGFAEPRLLALQGTAGLGAAEPRLELASASLPIRDLELPSPVPQRAGPIPLGRELGARRPSALASNDNRISATAYYARGLVWAVAHTRVGRNPGKVGAYWFAAQPVLDAGGRLVRARVARDGLLVAPGDTSVLYPAIAVDRRGWGIIGFSLAGPTLFPSFGTVTLGLGGTGPITVAGPGAAPADGLSGYDGDPQRWGDYGAAAVDEAGRLWAAGEFVPDPRRFPRSGLANWGIFVARLGKGR